MSSVIPFSESESYDPSNSVSPLITEDVEIRGDLAFGTQLEFNGRFEGCITSEGYLVIGEAALVKGNITAGSAVIAGKIQGEITVADKIHLKAEAVIHGDIKASTVTIEDGAYVSGKIVTAPTERSEVDFSNIFMRILSKK